MDTGLERAHRPHLRVALARRGAHFALALAALAVALVVDQRAAWIYQRTAILDGQLWRLLSGHVVHLSDRHLAWNLLALSVIAVVLGGFVSMPRWWAIAAGSALGAALGPLVLVPDVASMAGLSAVLHGLFAGAAGCTIARRERVGWLLLGALVLKLGVEVAAGGRTPAAAALGGPVATAAHIWGAAGGLVAGLLPIAWNRRRGGCSRAP